MERMSYFCVYVEPMVRSDLLSTRALRVVVQTSCLCGLCECSFSRVARSVRRTLALSISSGESVVR